MESRILLVNFNEKIKVSIEKLGIQVDLGYMSDAQSLIFKTGEEERTASFNSPLAIYEYKAMFINLTSNSPLKEKIESKVASIGEKEKVNFFKYWYDQKGIIVIFTEESSYDSLEILGLPQISLVDSSKNDKTINFMLDEKETPLRMTLKSISSSIKIPPNKYILLKRSELASDKMWSIFTIYENRNDEEIGIYLNWGYRSSDEDKPAFLVLPAYQDYGYVIEELLKSFSKAYPKFFHEIADNNWVESDSFFPKEVSLIDEEIQKQILDTEIKLEELKKKKITIKDKYSFLPKLLTESGEELKQSVIKTLEEIFKLPVADMDKTRKSNFRNDILISPPTQPPMLTEIKGTTNSYPSFTYVTQVLTNLLKERTQYPNAVGVLIMNHDLQKEPIGRSNAYTDEDEEAQINEIVYIDTRVLFDISMAIIDHKMPISQAIELITNKGRVVFDLQKFIKDQEKNN